MYKRIDGNLLEFDSVGRRTRCVAEKSSEVAELERPATVATKVLGCVFRSVTWLIRRSTGLNSIVAQASLKDDSYAYLVTTTKENGTQKTAMFSEGPRGKYKVWP